MILLFRLLLAPLPGLLPDVLSADVKAGILSLLEISCITRMPVMQLSLLPVVCGLLSFGGICVFMQLLASGGNWMHKAEFLAMRLLAALLSAGLCRLAAPFWMRNVAVSVFAGTIHITQSATPLLPILLVLMTFMILSQKSWTIPRKHAIIICRFRQHRTRRIQGFVRCRLNERISFV